ncbi:hypothetical protein HK102_001515, partial [Quaeritorhiza haematococci]
MVSYLPKTGGCIVHIPASPSPPPPSLESNIAKGGSTSVAETGGHADVDVTATGSRGRGRLGSKGKGKKKAKKGAEEDVEEAEGVVEPRGPKTLREFADRMFERFQREKVPLRRYQHNAHR